MTRWEAIEAVFAEKRKAWNLPRGGTREVWKLLPADYQTVVSALAWQKRQAAHMAAIDRNESINTVAKFRAAIRKAPAVYACVRFGVSEKCVRISKADALGLVKDLKPSDTGEVLEMCDGEFAFWDTDGDLMLYT